MSDVRDQPQDNPAGLSGIIEAFSIENYPFKEVRK
jgi:hypothetical protein